MNKAPTAPLLFLTGCINPDGMVHTLLQDPAIRKAQYLEAIRFYLHHTASPVLFVENSGTDISSDLTEEIKQGRLELLTFQGNNYPKQLGKGYGEMLIVEHALRFSKAMQQAPFVFKITGRYKVLNINSFIAYYNTRAVSCDLLVDFKQHLSYADSRLIGCTAAFLSEVLLRYKNSVNDTEKVYFEHALSKATHEAISKDFRFCTFKYKPRFSGTYGTDNTVYNDSWLHWFPRNIKYRLRYALNQ